MNVFVRLLGRPTIDADGQRWEPPADRRSALLYLLAHADGWLPREDAMLLFWPDAEEAKARANLRQLLVAVRALPFAGDLEAERTRLRWPVASDVARWRDAEIAAADGSGALPDPWPGTFLDGFRLPGAPEFESWLELERAAWHERVRGHVLGLAGTHARADQSASAAACLDRWLADHPLDEEALRAWMEVSAGLGRRAAILARYTAFERRLADEIGVAPEAATVALATSLRRAEPAPSPSGADASAPARRPRSRPRRSDLIGRDAELARLEALLTDERGAVVTLLAPGGIGKTRLALEAVERLRPRFADGCAVAFLAAARDADEVVAPLADALGVRLVPGMNGRAQLQAVLADRHLLVLLDNVEQIEGVADLIEEVQRVAPRVAWLLTSRSRLGVAGEAIVELGGLEMPDDATDDGLGEVPAVALLLRRARDAGVVIDAAPHAPDLRRLVRATGGMPLALELAAGWLRVRSLDAVAATLETDLDALEALDVDVEPRHRTMHAVFDASWQALTARERTAMKRLAVFRDGFVEAAAREVADVGLPVLLALRHKSFLGLGGDGRFRPHPLLEAYVRDRAKEDAAAWTAACDRHADWYGDYLARWEAAGQADQEALAVAMLQAEHANVEAAWAWAWATGRWHVLREGGALLAMSYAGRGRLERWFELLSDALERLPKGSVIWAKLESHAASTDLWAGRFERAFQRRSLALAAVRGADDRFLVAWVVFFWAVAARHVDRLEEARGAFDEAAALFAEAGCHHHVVMALTGRYASATDVTERERRFLEVLAAAERVGNRDYVAGIQQAHADFLATTYGAFTAATELADRSVAHERSKGDTWLPGVLSLAADLRIDTGDLAAAEALTREALSRARVREALQPDLVDTPLVQLARIARLRGEPEAAHALLPVDGRAAGTREGLIVRARLATDAGDLVTARGCADQALAQLGPVGAQRGARLALVEARVCSAEVASAMHEVAIVVRDLSSAIDVAIEYRFLPLLLHAVSVGLPFLPDGDRARVRTWVAHHPATTFAVRRRVAGVLGAAPDVAEVRGEDAESLWREAVREARAVRDALQARGGAAAGR